MNKFIITYAQNATPVHKPFWASVQAFAKAEQARIIVLPGRYKNATSIWNENNQEDEWWADEVTPHVVHERRDLCKNLTVYGDVSIQPTASYPLNGFEVFVGHRSAIFGHPKRQLKVVPNSTRMPRVLWSTGACTVPNYTDSKAGKKANEHHVLGALVVEVCSDGTFFVRNVTWDRVGGGFTDLTHRYAPGGRTKAPSAASLTLGDFHAGREDLSVLEATRKLTALLKPKNLVLHDFLDFSSRNHHDKSKRSKFSKRFELVENELKYASDMLRRVEAWGQDRTVLVRSNHDEALERWLEECDPEDDPNNAPFYHEAWAAAYRHKKRTGEWPNMFELFCRKRGSKAKFLKRDEPCRIKGVEHGFHGDKGPSGGRGSPQAYARLGCKVTVGHTHQACILDGVFYVGTTSQLDHGYNGLPSGWTQSHVIEYADGKRTCIFIFNGKFMGEDDHGKLRKLVA